MFTQADLELASVAAAQYGVFTLADASTAGLTYEQIHVRSMHAWERIHEGVYRAQGRPPIWRGDLLAACYAAEARPAAVSNWALAGLHGLPMGPD